MFDKAPEYLFDKRYIYNVILTIVCNTYRLKATFGIHRGPYFTLFHKKNISFCVI